MLTQLGGALVGLIDSVMVGHYATTDLAAVSFANGLFFTVMVFTMGAVMGVTPLVGYAFVRGDHDEVSRLLRTGWRFTWLLILFGCTLLAAAVPFLFSMGQDPAVAAAAKPYYITRLIGLVPFMLFCLCKQFFEGLGNTLVAMLITTVCNILNVILNWFFIFDEVQLSFFNFHLSLCNIPVRGAYGAGLASLIACTLMPLSFLIVMLTRPTWRQYLSLSTKAASIDGVDAVAHKEVCKTVPPFSGPPLETEFRMGRAASPECYNAAERQSVHEGDASEGAGGLALRGFRRITSELTSGAASLHKLAKVGIPIGLQTFVEAFLFTASFVMVGWLGKEPQAAHMVANQVADLTFMLALGIGAATTIRVSHQYGVRDYHAMRMAARASVHLVLLMNAIGATLMLTLRHYIPFLFSDDPEVIPIVSRLLVYAAIFQFSDGLQCVGSAALRGITDVRRPMIYAVIIYIFIALPLGYLLMFDPWNLSFAPMGVDGMWIAFILALALAAIIFHTRFWRLAMKMK